MRIMSLGCDPVEAHHEVDRTVRCIEEMGKLASARTMCDLHQIWGAQMWVLRVLTQGCGHYLTVSCGRLPPLVRCIYVSS